MNKDIGFSRKRIEENAKAADVISRAKAASPVASVADHLDRPGMRMHPSFGLGKPGN